MQANPAFFPLGTILHKPLSIIYWQSDNDRFYLNIVNLTGQATKTTFGSLTLNVDGTALAVSDAMADTGSIWSYNPATDWTAGQAVSLSLRTAAQQSAFTEATLSGLTASSGTSASGTFTALTLDQSFAAGTTAYTATVASEVTHVKLTPTVADANAMVKVGKGTSLTAVTSGSASGAIALEVGANNAIKVVVTAEDGSTTKTYTVTVTRAHTVSLSVSPNPVAEGTSVTVTATLSAPVASALTIPVTVSTASPNTAESGDVGTLTAITVNAGTTFTVSLGTLPTGYDAGCPSSVQVTINDDDGVVLSVVVSPACGSTITDMSMRPKVQLSATPPGGWTTD